MTELVDFDAARAERTDAPILSVKVDGRRLDLLRPAAGPVLDFLRAMRDPAAVTTGQILGLYEGLFGDKLAELQAALSSAELNELAGRYCGAAMKEGTNPNPKAPAAKRRNRSTSSSVGRSSRPTSSANTRSTSAAR